MNLELRHLRVICAIAETGSVTKAATALGLAQPALTNQLQRIERVFGGPLFERDQRGARPTPLGDLVLERAKVLLPVARGLQDEAARLTSTDDVLTHFRIGAVHGPILGGLVHRLTTEHPKARITTQTAWSVDELCEQVAAFRLDFALVGMCGEAAPSAEHGLVWREIAVDPVFVLLPESDPFAGKDAVELGEFADASWVGGAGDGCFGDCFTMACARAGFTPRTIYETDVLACLELVECGDAVGLGQGAFRRTAEVAAVPLAGTPLRWRHLIGWHPESSLAHFSGQLVRYAAASYAAAVRRSPRYAEWLDENLRFGLSHV